MDRWLPSSWRPSVTATQCLKGAIAYLAALFMGQLAESRFRSFGAESRPQSRLRGSRQGGPEPLVERTAVESHQSIGAAERMNREVVGLRRTRTRRSAQNRSSQLGRWSPSSCQPSVEGAQSLPRSARRAPSPTWQRSLWVSLRPRVSDQELWC